MSGKVFVWSPLVPRHAETSRRRLWRRRFARCLWIGDQRGYTESIRNPVSPPFLSGRGGQSAVTRDPFGSAVETNADECDAAAEEIWSLSGGG